LLSLKDKNLQLQKKEKLQKKLEDRFKEKVKQWKELSKERTIYETFLKAIFP